MNDPTKGPWQRKWTGNPSPLSDLDLQDMAHEAKSILRDIQIKRAALQKLYGADALDRDVVLLAQAEQLAVETLHIVLNEQERRSTQHEANRTSNPKPGIS